MDFRKKPWLMAGSAFLLTAAIAGCGNGGDDAAEDNGDAGGDGETYEWRFVTEENQGQVQYEYAEEFAERLNEKSDGQINIDVYEFGGLGSEVDQVEQLQSGVVEFAIVSPGFTGTMVEEGQLFALQFLFPDDVAETQEVLETSEALNTHLAEKYEEHNIKPLSFWTEGAMQWTGSTQLRTPDDFQGFAMRTQESPLIMESYRQYGADPTAMSWSELYTGLQQGTVDGQENPIFFIEDAGFHEVQDHMTISNHNNYVAMTTVNPGFYNDLPEDIQAMIDETVEEMKEVGFELQDQMNEELLDAIIENEDYPTDVYELNEDEREQFRELAEPMRDYFRENGGEDAAEILDMLEEEIEEVTGEEA
ncbi:DctP family TRAP transporter solute-binding subunit [Thalassorhabdus alkalitolerans]|uniref:DctP family TRAP transporter solute-binding subunit n=1 Tax=Thalassorhabdus alkalitolerans TaxID=2282697 RepID=A0ABW0YNX2_9BACI|nr:DctP family TRAP transporter solute-binding subunit [Thalassobacillus sp. C254]